MPTWWSGTWARTTTTRGNGSLATLWLALFLCQSNHRRVSARDWARHHTHALETLIGQRLRDAQSSDARLSTVLRRLHDADWAALEADAWEATCAVYEVLHQRIRLDSTTSLGYHTIRPEALTPKLHEFASCANGKWALSPEFARNRVAEVRVAGSHLRCNRAAPRSSPLLPLACLISWKTLHIGCHRLIMCYGCIAPTSQYYTEVRNLHARICV